MGKIQTYKIKTAVMVLLLFAAICSLQSLACATTPELPSGETVGQWVWLGKAVLFSSGCILIASFLQLFGKAYREDALEFRHFYAYVAWSLVLLGGVGSVGIVPALWIFCFRSFTLCTYRFFFQSRSVCGLSGNGAACMSTFVSAHLWLEGDACAL